MFSSVLAVLLSASSLVAAATCAPGRTYTVVAGDYCDAISAAHNSSTYQLAVSNQAINEACTNLQIGQSLCLGLAGQDCQATYVVQEGDYCDKVSAAFGINSTLLMGNNPQIDANCYNLYIGEVVCVATSIIVTPPPAGWTLPGASLDDGSVTPEVEHQDTATATPASTVPITTPVPTTTVVTSTSLVPVNNAVNGVTTPSTTSSSAPTPTPADDGDDDSLPDCED